MEVFLACRIIERKGGAASLTKLIVKEEDLLIVTINKALSKFIKSTDVTHINEAFNRIKGVTCNGCNLSELLIDDPDYNLLAMNSNDTPIFKKGIDIILKPIQPATTTAKKTKVCAHAVLMKRAQMELNYCRREVKDVNKEPEINEQTLDKVYEFFEEIELGYWSNDQKHNLTKNGDHLMKVLCFIQKYWKVLLRADYPHIPAGDFESSKLLKAIIGLNRKKKNEYVH